MAPGPLALLGEAIASGTGDWANLQREKRFREEARAREEQLYNRARADQRADVREARAFGVEQQKAQQDYEQRLYDARRFDGLRDHLVKNNYLNPADLGSPEAMVEALNAYTMENGPKALRDLDASRNYKRAQRSSRRNRAAKRSSVRYEPWGSRNSPGPRIGAARRGEVRRGDARGSEA